MLGDHVREDLDDFVREIIEIVMSEFMLNIKFAY